MNYIRITQENIDTEHICCAMSGVPRVEEAAKEHHIPLKTIHITTKEAAQNVPAPVTTYALFRDGQFVTQGIQPDKKFLTLAGIVSNGDENSGNYKQ